MNAKELGKEVICGGTQLFRTGGDGSARNVPDGIIGGLTKRELFALVLMHAATVSDGMAFAAAPDYTGEDFQTLAREGVMQADALLAELAKDQP